MPGIAPEGILYGSDGDQYILYAAPTITHAAGFVPYGTQLVMQDGRKYRFAGGNGSAALVVGNVIQAACDNTETNTTPAAGAIGDKSITFTAAGTEAANFFAQGFANVSVTPGGGDSYKILSHLTLAATSGQVMNLTSNGGLRRALTTTSRVDFLQHPYKGVIQFPVTTATGPAVGVAVSAIAISGYGWLQTAGVCAVLTVGTVVIGNYGMVPGATAGAVTPTVDNETNAQRVGIILDVAAAGAWSSINLTIDR